MPGLLSDKLNFKQKPQNSMTSAVKKKLNALENVLEYVKANGNYDPSHLLKSKQNTVKLFHKIIKIIKSLEKNKYKTTNVLHETKLPKLLLDLKNKTPAYYLESMFGENLQNSGNKQPEFLKSTDNICETKKNSNLCNKLWAQNPPVQNFTTTKRINLNKSDNFLKDKQFLVNEIDKYVMHYLVNFGLIKILTRLTDSIVNEYEIVIAVTITKPSNCELNKNLNSICNINRERKVKNFQQSKPNIFPELNYFSSNNNSSVLIKTKSQAKLKNYTTFINYDHNNHSVGNDLKIPTYSTSVGKTDPNSKRRNIYLKIKDLKDKTDNKLNLFLKTVHDLPNDNKKENTENKTIDEISSEALKCDLSSNKKQIENKKELSNKNNLETLQNATHSISNIHVSCENENLDKTINSNASVSQVLLNDSVYDGTIEVTKNNQPESKSIHPNEISNNIRCMRIINAAIQSAKLTRNRADILMKFILSREEKSISVKKLENIISYEIKSLDDGDNYIHHIVGINLAISADSNSGTQHEYKMKRNRIIKQIIMVPKITQSYLYNSNSKKDHRILHIEQFCNCQISVKNKCDPNDSLNCNSKSSILINIIYDIEKGNELGCVNMIRRMLNIFQYQVRIIREYRVTVEGNFEETLHK